MSLLLPKDVLPFAIILENAAAVSSCALSISASSQLGFKFKTISFPIGEDALSSNILIILLYSKTCNTFSFILLPSLLYV